jgi:very-short-patch-repair endonuclease
MTDAERLLWRRLRNRQACEHKFRRQHPIGPYVLDFFCEAAKLAVEIDGGQHAARVDADEARTQWLNDHGCRVLRFWNNEVLENIDGVLTTIIAAIEGSGIAAARCATGEMGNRFIRGHR